MPVVTDEVLMHAKVLWDYHVIPMAIERSDIILALGNNDLRVAKKAAELVIDDMAPLVVMSGGLGKVTAMDGGEKEALRFAKTALALGVEEARIILEEEATNTGQNFTKTRDLLNARGISITSGIIVTKPYMKRRALATAQAQWTNVRWTVSAPEIKFEHYPNDTISQTEMIELMVGDLQRMEIYAQKGFQTPQLVPDAVWRAYQELVTKGYDKYVIKD